MSLVPHNEGNRKDESPPLTPKEQRQAIIVMWCLIAAYITLLVGTYLLVEYTT